MCLLHPVVTPRPGGMETPPREAFLTTEVQQGGDRLPGSSKSPPGSDRRQVCSHFIDVPQGPPESRGWEVQSLHEPQEERSL